MLTSHPTPPQPQLLRSIDMCSCATNVNIPSHPTPTPHDNLRDRRAGKRTFCSVSIGRNTLARASLRPTGAKNKPEPNQLQQRAARPHLCQIAFFWGQGTILTSIFHHQASLNDKEVLSNLRPPGAEILHFSLAALSSFQQEWIDRTLDFMGFLTHREFW